MKRFIVLEHTGAPDDPAGRHYDLLLEVEGWCLAWRLATLPESGSVCVAAVELPPHRLAWLDHESGAVSGGRGFARRIDAGTFEPLSIDPDAIPEAAVEVRLVGSRLSGQLRLERLPVGWSAIIVAA